MSTSRWLTAAPVIGFLVITAALVITLTPFEPLAPPTSLIEPTGWISSDASITAALTEQGAGLRIHSRSSRSFASHAVSGTDGADFMRVKLCLAEAMPTLPETAQYPERPAAIPMLASMREGAPDFNRQFIMWGFYESIAGECETHLLSRLVGDGDAIAQVQVGANDIDIVFSEFTIQPIRHTDIWQMIRRAMLGAGLFVVAVYFLRYRPTSLRVTPRNLLAMAGLCGVAGILFGCCVSVGLKADIFALINAGASTTPAPLGLEESLRQAFPEPGFGVFTQMHAVFFCVTTVLLGMLSRTAILDMVLLAVTTETLQFFVPGRGPGISDALVDCLGIAIASGLLLLLWRSQRVRLFLEE